MRIISHRGNINGPIPSMENKPAYIDQAICLNYDVEVDVRYIDGKFFLGHDSPDYEINLQWLLDRQHSLWIHCKNVAAAHVLMKTRWDLRCFCGADDPFLIVNPYYLWVQDLEMELTDCCIAPLMTIDELVSFQSYNKVFGVCTDHPSACTRVE